MYKNYSERNFPTPRKEKEVGPSLRGKNIFFGRDWTNKNSRWHLPVLKNIFIDDAAYLGKRMKPLEEIRRFRKSQTAWIQTLVEFDSVRAILTSGQNPHRSMKPKKACFLSWKRGRAQKINCWIPCGAPFNSPPTGSPHMISSFPLDQEQRTWIWQSHLWRFQRLIGWSMIIPGTRGEGIPGR